MKRMLSMILPLLLIAAAMFHPQVSAGIFDAGKRCLTVLVPSLYMYAVLAGLCTGSGMFSKGGRGGLAAVLLFSQIAGYPVGAQLISGMYRSGSLTRREAQRMLCVCMGCGPGFLLGTVCSRMPAGISLWMLLSVSLPNVLLGLIFIRRISPLSARVSQTSGAALLTDAVSGAAQAMLRICGMVLAMAGAMALPEALGLFRGRAAVLRCVLEVSCLADWSGSLPMAAGLLAFGGICVHLQIGAVSEGLVPWGRFWAVRALCGVMSYGICRAGLPLFLPEGAVTAALQELRPCLTEGSVVPGLCLLAMSVLLLQKQRNIGLAKL